MEIHTPHGLARATLHEAPTPKGALVLGHGAGGTIEAPDLRAVTAEATAIGISVALVEQPYRVLGRRSPAPAAQLDTAWVAVLAALREGPFAGLPVVCGGRSSGARVACRTAEEVAAVGVLCLAFPLVSQPRRGSDKPPVSRQHELDAVSVPVLVIQGVNDRFGMPEPAPGRKVVQVAGDHALKKDVPAVATGAREWLAAVLLE